MKKLVILVLLVPILALTMISCDADMRSNLAGFMGGFGGNVYEDAGLIVVNTAQAEAAAAAIAAIGTGAGSTEVISDGGSSAMGLPVTDLSESTMLKPQPKAKQDEVKSIIDNALSGSQKQKDTFLDDLKKPASSEQKDAAKGTVEVFNKTLDKIKEELDDSAPGSSGLGKTLENLKLPKIDDGDVLTQGDLLALQLMTDLISNTVNTLTEIGGTLAGATDAKLGETANKDKVLLIVNDALFAAQIAEEISGSASINFSGKLDLGSLMDSLNKGTRSRGEPFELTEAEDFIGTINNLAPSIVELMGITYNGTTFSYEPKTYKSFLLNQQVYRSSMEQALKMMSLANLGDSDVDSPVLDTPTLVKYALAVFITEHDAFVKSISGGPVSAATVIQAYLNANTKLGLGTLKASDVLTEPTATGVDYEDWPAFIKGSAIRAGSDEGLTYFKAILLNIIKINDLSGIPQLSTQLNDFLADTSADGFVKTYQELME